jgi:hypothetical protein
VLVLVLVLVQYWTVGVACMGMVETLLRLLMRAVGLA